MLLWCKKVSLSSLIAVTALSSLLVCLLSSSSSAACLERARAATTALQVCKALTPQTEVQYSSSKQYAAFLARYMTSSVQEPACVFTPTSPQVLAVGIKAIGASGAPFAVSSGKHTSNGNFSSTTGVQIDLSAFKRIQLAADKTYVDVETGNLWNEVYKKLEGTGRQVVGGRATGVGVGGLITGGGGYSWLTNQHGLTVDTLLQVDMVLPDGTLTSASETTKPDLFAAIKGGGNQLGIVYNFRLATVLQTAEIFGGLRVYPATELADVLKATAQFARENQDPKAQIITTVTFMAGFQSIMLICFYDGPDPGKSFSMFPSDPKVLTLDDWKKRPFAEFVTSIPSDMQAGQRGTFHTVSLQEYSPSILQTIADQSTLVSKNAVAAGKSATFLSYAIEPFSAYGRHANAHGPTMFPHENSPLPTNIYFAWSDASDDEYFRKAAHDTADYITKQAEGQGQELKDLHLYPNYCLADTPAMKMYGAINAQKLRTAKAKYDPHNVMGRGTSYFSFAS